MYLIKQTIGNYISRNCRMYKDNEAIIFANEERRITYDELEEKVNMIAKRLMAIGVKNGDHISLCAENSPEWIMLFLATVKIGAVLVSLNNKSTISELNYFIKQSDSAVFITSNEALLDQIDIEDFETLRYVISIREIFESTSFNCRNLEIAEERLQRRIDCVGTDDIAMILYTSGTTGKPKAVMYSHSALLNGAYSSSQTIKCKSTYKFLMALPLCHIMGTVLSSLLMLMVGGTVILLKKFKPTLVLESIEKYQANIFSGVPTMYQYLLESAEEYDLSSLKLCIIGGARPSKKLLVNIKEKMTVDAISNSYGQSEALGISQTLFYDARDLKSTTAGKFIKGVEYKIYNTKTREEITDERDGELYIKSPYMMAGYYKNEEATKETIIDGWLRTGDIVSVDDEGYLSIKYRAKETIIKGGENISPIEIEEVLDKHEAIENTAIVGVPDEKMGEEIYAFIKLNDNYTLTEDEILGYMSKSISKFKLPKYIKLTDEFPLTSNGKVRKNVLKEKAMQSFRG